MEILYTEEQIFIPIISDYGFKATFGNETNTLFLRKALQALIKSEIPIKEIIFDKNSFDGVSLDGRSGIFDLACIDENGNHFIVEMQYGEEKHFIQRMKFYAFHKYNIMVKKGNFDYSSLTKIYCVAILAKNILDFPEYHTIANLRTENGKLFDDRMTYVTIELDKFVLKEKECLTNLQKLIYTMKTIHTYTKPIQFPQFWNEEWLKIAIDELDSRKLTADEKASLEILIARNAVAVYAEKAKLNEAREAEKMNTIINGLKMGFSIEQCAQLVNVSIDYVKSLKQKTAIG
jgi:predicted transposase/invertase (TIGR01784 family)